MLTKHFTSIIRKATGATNIIEQESLQTLWSGYGHIIRVGLEQASRNSVVVKLIQPPNNKQHPRHWNTDLSHKRKLKSYQVEIAWYQHWSHYCQQACRVPQCLAVDTMDHTILIVLEDLDDAGYFIRKHAVTWEEIKTCLKWLANFHATFMGEQPKNLWKTGTYWHLATRPDELKVLDDEDLKKAAPLIDLKLKQSQFQTFVHGDAKLANFCFSNDPTSVAAVDFQYVGAGCGMKDVAYFIGSCLTEDECEQLEDDILEVYFECLKEALLQQQKNVPMDALEQEWRSLYPVAWTDFHRFIKGWSPDHWKINSYSEKVSRKVVRQLLKKDEVV